ncbi:MAG TPA: flagellar basal body L-ring protein FlgH [Steroidobacteraceae bacterium]|nr:flagellar basal body L-ring protein FlgH [Steroidobacteraceae bacterium]
MTCNVRPLSSAGLVLVACALVGCQAPREPGGWDTPNQAAALAPAAPNGSIYQAGRDASLFSNATARNIGDLLTIRLEERTSASKSATTSTSKSTSTKIPGPTIGGRPVTLNGVPILETELGSEHAFDGEGDSAQSNQLSGSVTVTVIGRVGNGNLLVRGQKWLALNQGKEFIRVEGVVRAIDVEPDNSIASWKVADAKIAYGGRGALEDANSMGWLARFFQSPVMPF